MILSKITPEYIAALIKELEPQQHRANRGSVAIEQLVDKVLLETGYSLEHRARFEVSLKQAILTAAKQIPGMEFVDGG
jgi:hypothetical protein